MRVNVMCRKFECRKDIHYKIQTGTSCEKCNSKTFRLGIEPASSGLLDQCSTTELQKPLSYRGVGVAFFATGPSLDLIMYIFTTLEFPTHNIDSHLMNTSLEELAVSPIKTHSLSKQRKVSEAKSKIDRACP